jgi:6-phosphogluconolactonase
MRPGSTMRACATVLYLVACGGGGEPGDASHDAAGHDAPAVDASGSEDVGLDASEDAAAPPVRTFVYVGLTSGDLVTLDGATLDELSRTATGDFPSFVAGSADGRHLYVVHESADEVASVDVAPNGTTTVTARQSASGGPTHVALDHAGRAVFVASYGSGHVHAYRIDALGALSSPASVDDTTCAHNAHEVVLDAADAFLYVPCLGDDAVVVRTLAADGTLAPASVAHTAVGAGPRHLVLSSDGRFAYVLDELGSTLDVFSVDAGSGALAPLQTTTTLPAGFSGTNACAEILLGSAERFVYATNRGHDSVAVFSRDAASGRVTLVEHVSSGGMHPRSMALTRDGARLLVADRDSDVLAVLDVASDGTLTPARSLAMPGHPYFVGVVVAPR